MAFAIRKSKKKSEHNLLIKTLNKNVQKIIYVCLDRDWYDIINVIKSHLKSNHKIDRKWRW